MHEHLSGRALLWDRAMSVVLTGRIGLVSDGHGRSEIVVGSEDGEQEERLVFARGNSWVPVFHLIQVLRELYETQPIEVRISGPDLPCQECGGSRIVEDSEGNWRDCRACVP